MGAYLSSYSASENSAPEEVKTDAEMNQEKIDVIETYFKNQTKEMKIEIMKAPKPQKVPEPEDMPKPQRAKPLQVDGYCVISTKETRHHIANLFVRLPTGTTVVYSDFFNTDTVGELMTRINKKHGYSVNMFCLAHRGNIMDVMQKRLLDYGVSHNSTVEVQIRKSAMDRTMNKMLRQMK